MCPHCRAFISTSDRVCPYCDAKLTPRSVERSRSDLAGGFVPHARFITMLILTINFGLYAATALYSMRTGNQSIMDIDGQTLVFFGAKFQPRILFLGEWWRLITAGFLHGGLFHILMNTWALFDLGAAVEEMFGAKRMVVIYIASTILGFTASTLFSSALSVGSSAGVFGLIGAMIALGMRDKTGMAGALRGVYMRWALYGLLFGLIPIFQVDNAAHIGGLIGGFATAYVAGVPRAERSLLERFWTAAAAVCIFMTCVAFLKMYLWFSAVA